jgi:hypothetical protein
MATSSRRTRKWAITIAAAGVLAAAVAPFTLAHDSSGSRLTARGARSAEGELGGAFSRLAPAPAPPGWRTATIASGGSTLRYPPSWKAIPGDEGTVTAAMRDARGLYRGYLNVTPRQGAEQLAGWAAFRISRNHSEGDKRVHELAAAEGLRVGNGRASCLIDDYLSRVESHRYRELACIVAGRRDTSVFIGATLVSDWPRLAGTIEGAASALIER